MKKISILVLGLVLLAAACNKSKPAENSQTTSSEPTAQSETNPNPSVDTNVETNTQAEMTAPVVVPKTYDIQMTSSGFSPSTLTIKQGDTVKFTNSDTSPHWPASAPHPTHTDYPAFDAKKSIAASESWSLTFDKVGAWKFHDHLNPSSFGTITVTE